MPATPHMASQKPPATLSWNLSVSIAILATTLAFLPACRGEVIESSSRFSGIGLESVDGARLDAAEPWPEHMRLLVYSSECYSSGCYEQLGSGCEVVSEASGFIEVNAEFVVAVPTGNNLCAGDCRRVVADCGVIDTRRMMLHVSGADGQEFEARLPVNLPWNSGL